MRKSRLFSLLCAFWPGAGEMYLGLMKRGLAIMVIFWGSIGVMSYLGLEMLLFALPVLWFYSFFDTLTLRNLDYYALTELQERDDFFFQDLFGNSSLHAAAQKHHVLLGAGLVVLEVGSLWRRLTRSFWFSNVLPDWLYSLLYSLPSLALSFGIIALGVWLIRGRRMPADTVEDYPRYREQEPAGKEKGNDKQSA